jgi:phospholipid/cholesterol/gamma-HCH transport system substrate-binding protein
MSREIASARRVGLVVLAAVAVGFGALIVLGDQQNLFTRKNVYRIRFANVSGLAVGSAVQLNGLNVGSVQKIVLPANTGEDKLEVRISVAARYSERIRQGSTARMKTLGLLGDKFIELTSGSPPAEVIPPGGEIDVAPMTDVDRLAAAGEDVVNNVASISAELVDILGRIQRGEGLLGKILLDKDAAESVSKDLDATMDAIRKAAEGLSDQRGALGRLLHDRATGDHLTEAVARLNALLEKAENGRGPIPALLDDAATKERFDRILTNLDRTSEHLATVATSLDRSDSDALAAKLISDEAYGKKLAADLERLLANLREVAEKLNQGNGSAARLLNDPAFAQALQDIIVGVNDSKMLRWLIRNRQKKGIEQRYEEGQKQPATEAPPPAPPGG